MHRGGGGVTSIELVTIGSEKGDKDEGPRDIRPRVGESDIMDGFSKEERIGGWWCNEVAGGYGELHDLMLKALLSAVFDFVEIWEVLGLAISARNPSQTCPD